jgi:hypothetical protein
VGTGIDRESDPVELKKPRLFRQDEDGLIELALLAGC